MTGHTPRFSELVEGARACRACASMGAALPVIGECCGPVPADVMFIGEAPGRLGAARTGIPFSGDRSARNFEGLLAEARWTRDEVFVTNAVLCHPADERRRNRPPTVEEVRRCSRWLRHQIEEVDSLLVVTLGAIALAAVGLIEPHNLELRRDAGCAIPWVGRLLVPLYHPSARAMIHRSLDQQRRDYAGLRAIYDSLPLRARTSRRPLRSRLRLTGPVPDLR